MTGPVCSQSPRHSCQLWAPQTILLKIKCWQPQGKPPSVEAWQVAACSSTELLGCLPPAHCPTPGVLPAGTGQMGLAVRS